MERKYRLLFTSYGKINISVISRFYDLSVFILEELNREVVMGEF